MITSERDEYTACHLTPQVKAAIKKEARKENKSMSKFIYELLCAAMKQRGYPTECV
jgi:hypothetical protein